MKILAISDVEISFLCDKLISKSDNLSDFSVFLSCGDLNEKYVNSISNAANLSANFVLGNHDPDYKSFKVLPKSGYKHVNIFHKDNTIFLGISGSINYNDEVNQYSEIEMTFMLIPAIMKLFIYKLTGKLKKKRLIVFSHSPIFGINDEPESTVHKGFKVFSKIINNFNPLLWIHGHIHLANPYVDKIKTVNKTKIINIYGYKIIEIDDENNKISTSN